MGRTTLVVFVAVAVGFSAHSAPPAKDDAKDESAVKAKLTGAWRQISTELPREKQIDPNGGLTWDLFWPLGKIDPPNRAYLTDWDNEAQQWVGELYLNAKADPMWLDFKHTDASRERVWVGIIKFEGKNLRWVRSGDMDAKKWADAKGDVPERPKTFANKDGKPLGYVLEPIEKKK